MVDGKAGHGLGYAMCTSLGACTYPIWQTIGELVDHVAGQRSQSEIQEIIHDECYGSYINCLDHVLGKVTTATAILNSKGGERTQ